jgi:hypothetical protein
MEQLHKDILEIKTKLAHAGIVDARLVFMPQVPITGWAKEYVIEEYYGMKVARLISPPND